MVSSWQAFFNLVLKFLENTSLQVTETSLLCDVFYDSLAQTEFAELLDRDAGIFEGVDVNSMTLRQFYHHVFGGGAAGPNLFFRRLLHGVDLSVQAPTSSPMDQLRFQIAKQMRNYTFLVGDADTKQVVVVDACWDVDGIVALLRHEGLTAVGAICTHYHYDHCGGQVPDSLLMRLGLPPAVLPLARSLPGVKELMQALPPHAPCYVHAADADSVIKQTGLSDAQCHRTKHNDLIHVGSCAIRVLHTPGHTPGSQCLLLESFSPPRVLTGDTMFVGSFGRIDGDDCSASDLWFSINSVLGSLAPETVVYPAHDYSESKESTIARERQTNPAFRVPQKTFVNMYS